MKNKTIFITFSQSLSNTYRLNAEKLAQSALNVGFSKSYNLSELDIEDQKIKGKINEFRKIGNRGYGYYVWKPYIILSLLKKNKTDYIFYHDAGRIDNISYELTSYPDKVLEHIKKNNLNFFLGQQIPHHGNLSKWTKKDCFQIMQTDNSFFYNKPQIQSTWSIWKYSEESLNFLNIWLKYCLDARCVTDQYNVLNKANNDDFVVHRHDQSIYTLIAYKKNLDKKYYFNFSNKIIYKILINLINKIQNPNYISGNFLKMLDDTELVLKKKYTKIILKYIKGYLFKIWN